MLKLYEVEARLCIAVMYTESFAARFKTQLSDRSPRKRATEFTYTQVVNPTDDELQDVGAHETHSW